LTKRGPTAVWTYDAQPECGFADVAPEQRIEAREVGKDALGLRVVGPDGGRPTLSSLDRESFTVVWIDSVHRRPVAIAAWIWISRSIRRS